MHGTILNSQQQDAAYTYKVKAMSLPLVLQQCVFGFGYIIYYRYVNENCKTMLIIIVLFFYVLPKSF